MALLSKWTCTTAGMRTRMHAGLLDVLHDAADDDVAVLVAEGIHIQFIGSVQVLVHQHRPLRIHLHRCLNVALDVRLSAGRGGA